MTTSAGASATSGVSASPPRRTPPKRKARQLAKYLREERPDYAYLKAVVRALRDELDIEVQREPKTLPFVPSEDEIRRYDVALDAARIRVTHGKGGKDRIVPFPQTFRETLALHIADRHKTGGANLFESSWKNPSPPRGVRAWRPRSPPAAGLAHNMPPHRLRH